MPAVDALLSRHENTKLSDYILQLGQARSPAFQDNQDFIAEVAAYTRETLGSDLGQAIFEELQDTPQVLTANHHGIDTFAQSTQSNLLFAMRKTADGRAARTIPVLACGSVPLNNLTYPRGLLIYAGGAASAVGSICKLPIFPDSHKRKLVSVAGPITGEMLARCRARASRLVADDEVNPALGAALQRIFDDVAGIGHDFSGYGRQATLVNHRFWRHLFRDHARRAELVYIELEFIVSRLLQNDLFDQATICHQLFFDPQLRALLIDNLDGKPGCWRYQDLLRRCSPAKAAAGYKTTDSAQGTMFFWGVDAKGRKISLCLVADRKAGSIDLRGIDDNGQPWTHPFTPADLARGLREGRLLPSIFTSYLVVAIARGISCIGGYYQAEYLPVMHRAVVETLRSNSGETVTAIESGKLRPDLYLSGMQAVGLKTDGQLLPAGPLEIIASGGLNAEQYEQIGEVTLLQSHVASLYDTILDVFPQRAEINRAKKQITRLAHDSVSEKIVTISIA